MTHPKPQTVGVMIGGGFILYTRRHRMKKIPENIIVAIIESVIAALGAILSSIWPKKGRHR